MQQFFKLGDHNDYLKLSCEDTTTVKTIISRLKSCKYLSTYCGEKGGVFISQEDWRKNATRYACNKK